jgi:hypothetical protein
MKRLPMLVLAAVATAGCAQGQPPAAAAKCNAPQAQFAVGQAATPQLAEEARRRSGSSAVRVIKPGDMVTLEFSEQRLNLEVDAANRVLKARCG